MGRGGMGCRVDSDFALRVSSFPEGSPRAAPGDLGTGHGFSRTASSTPGKLPCPRTHHCVLWVWVVHSQPRLRAVAPGSQRVVSDFGLGVSNFPEAAPRVRDSRSGAPVDLGTGQSSSSRTGRESGKVALSPIFLENCESTRGKCPVPELTTASSVLDGAPRGSRAGCSAWGGRSFLEHTGVGKSSPEWPSSCASCSCASARERWNPPALVSVPRLSEADRP